jgi:ankyrin repeat protein
MEIIDVGDSDASDVSVISIGSTLSGYDDDDEEIYVPHDDEDDDEDGDEDWDDDGDEYHDADDDEMSLIDLGSDHYSTDDDEDEYWLVEEVEDALIDGDDQEAERLLGANPELLQTKAGRRILHDAVAYNRPAVVRGLVERGVDVNKVDLKSGRTPLYNAAVRFNEELVGYFLANGADTSIRAADGANILLSTCQGLYEERQEESLNICKRLLEHAPSLDVNEQGSSDQWTCLHWAAYAVHAEVVRLLLEHGADHTITECKGRVPRAVAAYDVGSGDAHRAKYDEVVALLAVSVAEEVSPPTFRLCTSDTRYNIDLHVHSACI